MTDHLDEAAAKAMDLAEDLLGPRSDLTTYMAAAHLTYMAGLLRGGGVASYEDEALVRKNVRLGLQLVATQRERDQARAQRDDLLAAARTMLSDSSRYAEHSVLLNEVCDRVELGT